jgi:hypothetical protein
MKNALIVLLLLISNITKSQVIADVGVDTMYVTDFSLTTIDEMQLPLNGKYQLKIPVFNKSITEQVPLGTCKIKIGLGSKLILDPIFDLLNSEASQYFSWTSELNSGQIQITGDLKQNLPSNFFDTLSFDVIGSIEGLSTVTTNFLISNHNSPINLSDNDPVNNSTFLPYRIIVPVPVTFTSINAYKNKCNIDVLFTAEREYDVIKYEIETSKNGTNFTKVGTVNANQAINYNYSFTLNSLLTAPTIYIRIKSIDRDGQYQYSTTKAVNGQCIEPLTINLYPNPLPSNNVAIIKALTGNFNGNYTVTLYDAIGKQLQSQQYKENNTTQIKFPVLNIPAGTYLLRIISINNPTQQFQVLIKK